VSKSYFSGRNDENLHGTKMHGVINIFHDYNFLIMIFDGSWCRILGCDTQILCFQGLSSSQQRGIQISDI
jgi:hypothetical protein